MDSSGVLFATPVRTFRVSFAAVCLAIALLITGALAAAAPTRAASPEPLKAVFIVGPAGSQTAADLADAEQLATLAESYGMDVRRVFFPHATWDNVMANIQGANLVYYAGHGYGWPSPYTKVMTESRQNGVGLNTFDGSNTTTYTYYGANVVRANWVLAPNAWSSSTTTVTPPATASRAWLFPPGTSPASVSTTSRPPSLPSVPKRSSLSYQRFNKVLTQLATLPDKTMEDLFRITGAHPTPEWGWVGTDPRKFDSVRSPGAKNFMDPHTTQGFLRAVTGDLTMTGNQWRQGVGSGQTPSMSNFNAQTPGMNAFAPSDAAFFTPNGDGVTDSVALKFNVDREAFVAMVVKNQSGDVVRNLSAWSPGGLGSGSWNGKKQRRLVCAGRRLSVSGAPAQSRRDRGQQRHRRRQRLHDDALPVSLAGPLLCRRRHALAARRP